MDSSGEPRVERAAERVGAKGDDGARDDAAKDEETGNTGKLAVLTRAESHGETLLPPIAEVELCEAAPPKAARAAEKEAPTT